LSSLPRFDDVVPNGAINCVSGVFETICAMTKRLRLPGIPFDDENKLDELSIGFENSRRGGSPLYGCVATDDGIAIMVMKPLYEDNPASYWCRNGF
jgi:hypothetical protein